MYPILDRNAPRRPVSVPPPDRSAPAQPTAHHVAGDRTATLPNAGPPVASQARMPDRLYEVVSYFQKTTSHFICAITYVVVFRMPIRGFGNATSGNAT